MRFALNSFRKWSAQTCSAFARSTKGPRLSQFKHNLLWAGALLVAACGSDIFSRIAWRRILKAAKVLLLIARGHGQKVSEMEYHRRLRICADCVVWFSPLKTCGSPLRGEAKELGCWCFMPEKARYADSQCWGDEEIKGFEMGWLSTL